MYKKFAKSFIGILLAVLTVISAAVIPSSAAKQIRISKSAISVVKGYSATLSLVGTNKKPVWSSADESIATVTKKGKVTGIKLGVTTVSAKLGKKVYKCTVTVKAGSVASGANSVFVEKGKTAEFTVKAVGSHDIAVKSLDKSIAAVSLSGDGFKNDITKVIVKGIADGTTKVKIYLKGYEKSIYKYIKIKVGTGKKVQSVEKEGITTSIGEVFVNENLTESFTITSTTEELRNLTVLSTSKSYFDVESSIDIATDTMTVKVYGICEGSGTIRIVSKDQKTDISLPVTVTNNTYDVVVYREPKKRVKTDVIYFLEDGSGKKYYVLEPKECEESYAMTLLSEAADYYEYYRIYEDLPTKREAGDSVLSKKLTYKGKKVTWFILVPEKFDEAYGNSLFAYYSGEYEYFLVYSHVPSGKKTGDKVFEYDYTPPGKTMAEKRYILTEGDAYAALADDAFDKYKQRIEDMYKI